MSDILVYIEHDDDGITDISLQCISKGRKLADAAGLKLGCVVLGADVAALAGDLATRGVDLVYTVANAALEPYLARPTAKAMVAVVAEKGAKLCLLPSSTVGNDLGPYLGGLCDAGVVLDCQDVECAGDQVVGKRMEFDAKVMTSYAVSGLAVITVADGIDEPAAAGAGAAETVAVDVALEGVTKSVVEKREVAHKTVNLKDAKVIIGGGAGVGSSENFSLLEALAAKLNAEIGATRASVDAGWVSAERQIGQTGVKVGPDLYIACGISGAVQHLVGIRDAKCIVAINTDMSAPIFKTANYKVVGDLATVVPKLTELFG